MTTKNVYLYKTIYFELEMLEDAEENWLRAADLDPHNKDIQLLLNQFEEGTVQLQQKEKRTDS